jgi:DNA replication and repair protein RecF
VRLAWLDLTDFRSYPTLRLELDPVTNIFVGDNGMGKTNLLEAVAYMSRLSSFRGVPDTALVRRDAERAVVRGEFEAASSLHLVEVEVPAAGRRRVRWNGKQPRRFSALAAELPIVTFLPDDVALVKGGPGERRRYLDELAASLSPVAAGAQADLAQAIKQRNALLRSGGAAASDDDLAVWESQIAASGAAVLGARLEVARSAGPVIARVYGDIGGDSDIVWSYEAAKLGDLPKLAAPVDAAQRYRGLLERSRPLDRDRKMTTVGPHRDVPGLQLGGLDSRTHASQGEQRTLSLAMRLAAFELIAARRPDPPLVILDDVFSELDAMRARRVIDGLPEAQTLITTARAEDVPASGRRWNVTLGGVTP